MMKIRIQDNSIRYRLTLREVEALATEGRVTRQTQVLGPDGPDSIFSYELRHDPTLPESRVKIDGAHIIVSLCDGDRATLLTPEEEGVYIRREWIAPGGEKHRFMAFVEKDRPGSTCIKAEAWIYDLPVNTPVETRPIPGKKGD